MDQIRLDPQDKLPPTPIGHVYKTPSPHRTKKCLQPTPPPRIISGTALKCDQIHNAEDIITYAASMDGNRANIEE